MSAKHPHLHRPTDSEMRWVVITSGGAVGVDYFEDEASAKVAASQEMADGADWAAVALIKWSAS